nr:AMIN domain-containing protein [Arenimonas sp.]
MTNNMSIKKSNSFRSNFCSLGVAFCFMLSQQVLAANVLKDVKTSNQADGNTVVTFQFAEPIDDVKSFSTNSPPRIAIDLPETTNAVAQQKMVIKSGLAKTISTTEAGGRTRVVVDLSKNTTYHTQAIGNSLILTIDNKSVAQNTVSVSAIDFNKSENGAGRLIIKFDSSGAAAELKDNGSEVVIDVNNAQLPADLRHQMDVAGYATPVLNIDARDMNGKTRLVVNTKGKTNLSAYQTGNEYVVEISPKELTAKSNSKSNIAKTGAVGGSDKKVYSGKPVTFNFQDIPVRTVLQLIAEESSLNIVAADSVAGNVTLRLVNVPWDQALEIVLRAKGLDQRRDGNVVWVGPQPEIAAFEQAREDARIALTIRQETVTEYIPINYGNAESIAKLLTENSKAGGSNGGGGGGGGGSASVGGVSLNLSSGFLSPRGSVSYDTRTNTLLVIDIPKKIAEIK